MGWNVTSLCVAVVAALFGAPPEPPDSSLIADSKLEGAGMYRYWQTRLPLAKDDSLVRGHLVDEAMYVITAHGNVFAIQADVGLIRWAMKLTEPDYRIWAPAHVQTPDGTGQVLIPTPGRVSIVDRFSGALVQSISPGFGIAGPVAGLGDDLFLGGNDERLYSLRVTHASGATQPLKRWEALAGGRVAGAPLLYGEGKLLFASHGGNVVSCYVADKALNWAFRADGAIAGDPVVDGTGVYVASVDRSLYKLQSDDGSVAWRVRLPRPLTEGPVVAADIVFQYCTQHGIFALDSATGQERWRSEEGRAFVAHGPGGDVLFATGKRLLIVDHATGAIQSSVDVPAVIQTVTNTSDDAVYLLGSQGRVLCARLDAQPYLRKQQVISARERLNLAPGQGGVTVEQTGKDIGGRAGSAATDPLRSPRDRRP